ncbi:cobyrinate a,c-diamide synthase [uncultured Cohaesibacter sp.]|uniref:cobyrinate a,c-diamide synthase n=1 Tax=uncultured Cohaesibacter sp. TaxID=1002546 RepID=UPI00292EA92E|nr:cobyrinate a,c-diamide synthase [uncultured Cohaesibacter sp.]
MPTHPKGLILAAANSNSGKTTLSLGLQRLFKRKGIDISPAKCGPDYIDPVFHEIASGRTSINLDPWAMSLIDVQMRARSHVPQGEALFVEGVMGLFDGAAGGRGSTASLAQMLNLPIILVLDVKGQAQTAAAIAQGIKAYDRSLTIAGVLLNRVGSMSHELLLREAFSDMDMPVVGAVRKSDALELPSRHLGLVQAEELKELDRIIDGIADHMEPDINFDAIVEIAHRDRPRSDNVSLLETALKRLPPLGKHIAIARDEAFSFIYSHILDDWWHQGAEISFFSPLRNQMPSMQADAIYLPGGYPELHLSALEEANYFKISMQQAANRNVLIYGECGGYMVLGQSIVSKHGEVVPMLDLLPLQTSFEKRRLSLGYRQVSHDSALPFGQQLTAHEFHYATVLWQDETDALFEATNASGKPLPPMGQRVGTVHGSFAHVIAPTGR